MNPVSKIVRLDDRLSNKIAAGEVVERPASVVKELVENAVDAGSTRIEIEIEDGGLSKIRVVDNGSGLEKDDVELAFHRHATSKIKNEHDLFHIATLGFRGEALPSIASVSRLELKTSNGKEPGSRLIIEGGKVVERGSAASRKGTEIIVTRLFYNTPARLKHLKTVHTELGNITDAVYRIALAYPGVALSLFHNGKRSFHTTGSEDLRQVLASIYGVATAKKTVMVSAHSIDFKVSGLIVKPEVTRASRQHMMIFMNGRYIRNYPISQSILEGFHTLLPIRRFPIAVICIEMDPTLIDVNVHPSKLEARLSKENEVSGLVEKAIKEALRKLQLIPESIVPKQKNEEAEQQAFTFEQKQSVAPKEGQIAKQNPAETNHDRLNQDKKVLNFGTNTFKEEDLIQESFSTPQDLGEHSEKPDMYHPNFKEELEEGREDRTAHEGKRLPLMYPIGQMQGTYILAQNENGLYIVDQHAAQERIKYEFYKEKVGQVNSEVQELLVPITFEFSSAETAIVEENINQLNRVGVFLEPFGQGTYLVRSHPQWFPEGFEKETIEGLIFQILDKQRVDIAKLREEAAILMSCKRSIKANHHLRNDEMYALLNSLRETIDPFTCPHGRPIVVHFSTYDMEKMFKRVM